MQVTSLLSQHEHDDKCGCGHDHEHSVVHLWQAVLGVVCVLNAFIVDWLFEAGTTLASASAMIGALILIYPIVVTAVKDLRVGRLSINELVAIAVLAAFASGDYKTAGVVAFFMLTGELIESRTAEGARNSIESLIKLTPTKARRILKDGNEEEVPASQLAVGDVIRIRPGDNVAADGIILSGQGSFNQATITGESLPADKKTGDEVFAGTQNLTGVLEIKVSRAGTDTTLGRVRELIIAAEKTKLPIQKIVDQYMGFYTPLVLVIGALVWAFTHDLSRVIAVFVVSCPCAFILATPTAMVAALSAAARLGILIKNVADIETAAKINAFIFDKTGTLTTGQLAVSRLAPIGETKPAELLLLAASAEKYSNHPTAKALANLAAGDISIAMGAAGSEVAIHSATIALMNNDLRRLPFLVKLSRSTRAVINQNFLFGVLFIIVGLTITSFGVIGPIVAALLHNVGSLIVIFNSARLVRKGEELEHFHPEMETFPQKAAGQLTPKLA